jgi:hypothetical protein
MWYLVLTTSLLLVPLDLNCYPVAMTILKHPQVKATAGSNQLTPKLVNVMITMECIALLGAPLYQFQLLKSGPLVDLDLSLLAVPQENRHWDVTLVQLDHHQNNGASIPLSLLAALALAMTTMVVTV